MITKKHLSTLASKDEVKRVMVKLKDRDQTKIKLLNGEVKVIGKNGTGYKID